MIVDAILTVLFAPIRALLEVLPTFTWPSVFTEDCGLYTTIVGCWADDIGRKMSTLDGWLPMRELAGLLPVLAAAWVFYLGVKVTRFVISLVTGGGGAT